jgi:hypothetical protein
MPDKKHHIDNLFETGLKGHKVAAPQNAWSRLQHDLQKPPRTAFFYFSRTAAAVVMLMLAFGAGYFLSEINRDDNLPVIVQSEKTAPETDDNFHQNDSDPISAENFIFELQDVKDTPLPEATIQTDKFSDTKTEPVYHQASNTGNDKPDNALASNERQIPSETVVVEETVLDRQIEVAKSDELTEDIISGNNLSTEEMAAVGEEIEAPEMMTPEMLQRMLVGPDNDLQFAETEFSTNSDDSRWSIGGRVSPVYSYRTLGGDFYTTPDEKVDPAFFDQNEEGITTIAGGISLDYQLNRRLSLGSGMFVSRIGQQNDNVLAYNDPDFSNMFKLASSTGSVSVNPAKFETAMASPISSAKDSIPGDYIINGSFIQNLDYLEIPFVLKYKLIESKISLQLVGGLSPGILVNNRSYFNLDGEKLQTGTTENIDPFIYNSIVGFGLSYSLTEKLSFNMEPSFKYALSPVNSSTGINYHPYSFSWFTGISYLIY